MHTLPLQIRFNDVDQMGHVNNAVIMEYFDLGKSHYFKDAGIPVTPDEGDFAVMVVHVEVDFQAQIRYHDHIAVTSQVERFGTKSVSVLQQVVDTASGKVFATGRTVLSGYSRQTRASAPIPDDIKARVAAYDASH